MIQTIFFAQSALRRSGRPLGLVLALCGAFPAHAINMVGDQDVTKPLLCLSKSAPPPVYPKRIFSLQRSGILRVKLSFSAADRAPEVEILNRNGSDELVDEVQRYLRGYRLPCLVAGQKLEAVQEFSFNTKSGESVHWNDMRYVMPPKNTSLIGCLRTTANLPRGDEAIPIASKIKRIYSGNVLLQIRFVKPDAEPEVSVAYNSSKSAEQVNMAIEQVSQYRLPCLPENAQPVTFAQWFVFRESSSVLKDVIKDTSLMSFLKAVKNIHEQKVKFDLDTMACPFVVVWAIGQPAFKNWVTEFGERNLNRVEFLAWLEGLTLNLSPDVFEQEVGQEIVIIVPCGTIDFTVDLSS